MAIANVLLGYGAGLKETVLTASDGAAGDRFGYSVAMSKDGNYLAAGAIGTSPDAVYIFSRSGSTWSQMQKLSAEAVYVAINADGTRLLAASDYSADPARLYTRSGSTWSLTGTVPYSGPVAISGDGQHFAVAHGIYVDFYSVSGSTVTARGQVYPYPYAGAGTFSSIAMDHTGSVCVAGAQDSDHMGTDSGRVDVLNRSGSTWTAEHILYYSPSVGTADYYYFGASVAINNAGTIVEVGLPGESSNQGATRTFTWSGSAWSGSLLWRPRGSFFGKSVALDSVGTRTAVSSNNFVTVVGGGLPPISVGKPSGENFGRQISLSGNGRILAVGAESWNSDRGRVYVYG